MIDSLLSWLWYLPLQAHGDALERMLLLGLIAIAPSAVVGLVLDHFLLDHCLLRRGCSRGGILSRAPLKLAARIVRSTTRIVLITLASSPAIVAWNSYPMLVPAWMAMAAGVFPQNAATQPGTWATFNFWLFAGTAILAVLWVRAKGSGAPGAPPTSPPPVATARTRRSRCRALHSWWLRR